MSNTTTPKTELFDMMMGDNGAWDPNHVFACPAVKGKPYDEAMAAVLGDENDEVHHFCGSFPPVTEKVEIKCCDVPYCENTEHVTPKFGCNVNIKCMNCEKFTCHECCDRIWKGEWDGEEFYKPKMTIYGRLHQIWKCPFCRASFDRIIDPQRA